MLHTVLLAAHVLAGTAGLVLGPLAMYQDTRRFLAGRGITGRSSGVYRGAVLLVCLSAVGLVVESRPDLWWLVPVSALTYALAVLARESARRRFRGWSHGYAHGQGGSYIALVTALIVVALTVDGPVGGTAQLLPWLAPTALGTVLIEIWRRYLDRTLPTTVPAAARSRRGLRRGFGLVRDLAHPRPPGRLLAHLSHRPLGRRRPGPHCRGTAHK